MQQFVEKALDRLPDRWFLRLSVVVMAIVLAVTVHADEATWADASTKFRNIQHLVAENTAVWLGLVIAFISYVAWYFLVRFSHRRWLQTSDPHQHDRSDRATGQLCVVVLRDRWNDESHQFERGILVENLRDETLQSVTGRVRLYHRDTGHLRDVTQIEQYGAHETRPTFPKYTRTAELPFEASELQAGVTAIARPFEPRVQSGSWDTFDAFLDEVKADTTLERRVLAKGPEVIRGYGALLNLRFRRTFWPRKRRYETSWIERALHRCILPYLRSHMTLRRRHTQPPTGALEILCLGGTMLAAALIAVLATLAVAYMSAHVVGAVIDVTWNFLQRKFS